jgi:hypothetical protein
MALGVGLLFLFLSAFEGIGPERTVETAAPFSFGWVSFILITGGALTALATLRDRFWVLSLVGIILLAAALQVLEVQTQSRPWHRGVPHPFGLGPDLLIAISVGIAIARPKARIYATAFACGALLLALAPVPVVNGDGNSRFVLGLFGFMDDFHKQSEHGLPLAILHLGFFSFALYSLYKGIDEKRRIYLLAAFGAWTLLTGIVGSGGWVSPIGEWSSLGHGLTRVGALGLIALGAHRAASQMQVDSSPTLGKISMENLLAGFILLVFFLFKWQGMHWSSTDENIYFYAADAATYGTLPYDDYFYAHPPLRVFIPAIIFRIFGFSLITAQGIPVLACMIAGICLWRALRKTSGPWAGLAAMALYFSASQVMKSSTDMTGINMTMAFVMGGVLAHTKGRNILSGVLLACATGVGMIALWWFPCVVLGAWVLSGRDALKVLGGFLGTFALIQGLGALIGGEAYFVSVFKYHTLKTPQIQGYQEFGGNPFKALSALPGNLKVLFTHRTMRGFFYHHGMLIYLGCMIAPAFLLARRGQTWVNQGFSAFRMNNSKKPRAALWLLALPAGFCFFALLREQNSFYWAIFMPVPAALIAIAGKEIFDFLKTQRNALLATVILCVALLPAFTLRAYGNWHFERTNAGPTKIFPWRTTAPTDTLDSLTVSFFFKPFRVKGELEASHNHYFWDKKLYFSKAEKVADFVRENTPPSGTITGSSSLTPLVALLANRRMSADEVDTNFKVFDTGLREGRAFWQEACKDRLTLIVGVGMGWFLEPRRDPQSGRFIRGRTTGVDMQRYPELQQFRAVDPANVFIDNQLRHNCRGNNRCKVKTMRLIKPEQGCQLVDQ